MGSNPPCFKSGSSWHSFPITCLPQKSVFSNLRSHPRILEMAFRELPVSFPASQWLSGKEPTCPVQETGVQSLDEEDPLEKEMATHSSILAWDIPWTSREV